MDNTQFIAYKNTISDDYCDLAIDLLSKYDIFANDLPKFRKNLIITSCIIDYLKDDLILTTTEGFNINILTHTEIIKLSECLNHQLNTRYKPTFVTDGVNYKSIREGGF